MNQIETTGDARSYLAAIDGRLAEVLELDIRGILAEQNETAEMVKDFVQVAVIGSAAERDVAPPEGANEAAQALEEFQEMIISIGFAVDEFVGYIEGAKGKLDEAQNAFGEFSA